MADGAQRAASKSDIRVASGISSPVKARGDQRSTKSGSTECSGALARAAAADGMVAALLRSVSASSVERRAGWPRLHERALSQIRQRLPDLVLGVHHERPVADGGLLERLRR